MGSGTISGCVILIRSNFYCLSTEVIAHPDGHKGNRLIRLYNQTHTHTYIPSVHCAGLLVVRGASQNMISADTMVSPGKLKDIHSIIT
jgi:hypothetical protein